MSSTRRTLDSAAPIAPSTPIARVRRWPMTVNPATAMRPMNSIPKVAAISTISSPMSKLGGGTGWMAATSVV